MARPSNNRTSKRTNKKTQKQGRSKRGGVDWKGLLASLTLVSLGLSGLQKLSAPRAAQVMSYDSQEPSDSPVPYDDSRALSDSMSKVQILTVEQMRNVIKPDKMSPDDLTKLNQILPTQRVVVDGENKVTTGVFEEEYMPEQFVFFPGLTPEIFRDIEGFALWNSRYGARSSSVPANRESVVFTADGMYVAIPRGTQVTPESVQDAAMKSFKQMFTPYESTLNNFEMDSETGLVTTFKGGSRKRRPKTKRRSKRY